MSLLLSLLPSGGIRNILVVSAGSYVSSPLVVIILLLDLEEKGMMAVLSPRSMALVLRELYLLCVVLFDGADVGELRSKGLLQTGQTGRTADEEAAAGNVGLLGQDPDEVTGASDAWPQN